MIAKWVDSGAPRGNAADMPQGARFDERRQVAAGQTRSDRAIARTSSCRRSAPDKWGSLGMVPTGLTEDRYVSSVEVREVNDIPARGRAPRRWAAATSFTT